MSKKQTKESHFIPSEFPAVTQYENEFVSEWNKNTAEAVGELLKYIAKTTASAIKDGIDKDEDIFEKAKNVGDIHPKHSDWVWTEYKPGKFDWRVSNSKNKVIQIWEVRPEINSLKTSKDCVDFIINEGVVTNQSDLSSCDLDSAKSICSTLMNLKKVFKFEPITIRMRKLSGATMQAISGQLIEVNSDYFKNFDRKRYYDNVTVKYQKRMTDGVDYIDRQIKKALSVNPKADVSDLQETKTMLEDKVKKFPRWTMGEIDTLTQDIIIHEMGHILNSQCSGGCGHRFSPNSRTKDYLNKCSVLNKERNETFSKYIKGDKCISEYSTVKPAEFFAESFVAYVHKDKELPKYVYDFMDKYFKTTTPKI